MFQKLKTLVAELTRLEHRADKWRGKTGRIEISVDERKKLAKMTGQNLAAVSGELTIEEYVALIDEAIAAAVSWLEVSEEDGISEEI